MQGLDRQFDAGPFGVVEQGRDRVGDLPPRGLQGLARHGTAHQHEQGGTERCGLAHRAPILVHGGLPAGRIPGGKETTATERNDVDSRCRVPRHPPGPTSRPSNHCRQTVIPRTPAAAYRSVASSIDQGRVVIVWTHSREKSASGRAAMPRTSRPGSLSKPQ